MNLRKQSHNLQLKEWPEQAEYLGDNAKIKGKGGNSGGDVAILVKTKKMFQI